MGLFGKRVVFTNPVLKLGKVGQIPKNLIKNVVKVSPLGRLFGSKLKKLK